MTQKEHPGKAICNTKQTIPNKSQGRKKRGFQDESIRRFVVGGLTGTGNYKAPMGERRTHAARSPV